MTDNTTMLELYNTTDKRLSFDKWYDKMLKKPIVLVEDDTPLVCEIL